MIAAPRRRRRGGAGVVLIDPGQSRSAEGPTDDQVAAAIAKGVAYLKETQRPEGNWSFSFNLDHDLGITALAGLALLENGVDPADKAIGKATEVVRTLAIRSDQTYDLRAGDPVPVAGPAGEPGPPRRPDPAPRATPRRRRHHGLLGLQRAPRQRRRSSEGRQRQAGPGDREETAEFPLAAAAAAQGGAATTRTPSSPCWGSGRPAGTGSTRTTALESIDGHFRGSQNYPGRWGYKPGMAGTNAMTCAGLMGLAIAAARPKQAERLSARARGAALAADPVFASALRCVAEDAREISEDSDIYYLWSLERVCVALGLRADRGLRLVRHGRARAAATRQHDDGSWPEQRWGSLPNTCLALLFLRKANLAFELDRVLKLPGARRPRGCRRGRSRGGSRRPVARGAGGDVSVLVTGASDAKFPEIAVEFEVKRPDGSFLLDAKQADFRVTEDEPADVASSGSRRPSATERMPTTVVLVVDRSLSMEEEDRIGSLKQAVATFRRGCHPGSRVAVVAFGSEVETDLPVHQRRAAGPGRRRRASARRGHAVLRRRGRGARDARERDRAGAPCWR